MGTEMRELFRALCYQVAFWSECPSLRILEHSLVCMALRRMIRQQIDNHRVGHVVPKIA
jgi:hypothetical protein